MHIESFWLNHLSQNDVLCLCKVKRLRRRRFLVDLSISLLGLSTVPHPPLASPPFPAPRHRGFLSPLFVLHLLPHLHATLAPCLVSNPFVQHLLGTLDLCSLSVKVSLGLSVSLCLFLSISICHAPFPPPGRGNMSLTACFPIHQLVHVVALCVSLVDFYDQTCTPPAKVTVEVQY